MVVSGRTCGSKAFESDFGLLPQNEAASSSVFFTSDSDRDGCVVGHGLLARLSTKPFPGSSARMKLAHPAVKVPLVE